MTGEAILEAERLSLREITADDCDDLLEIWGDPEPMRFFQRTLDRQSLREWIERNQMCALFDCLRSLGLAKLWT